MTNIKISCIVPVYNTELFVAKCIKSILGQTYRNLELILIDDGSVDKSGVICDEFAAIDNRVRVIHQKNAGVSAARNIGIIEAVGDYICFVDSDDYIENDYFELAITYIKENKPNLFINNHIKDNGKHNKRKCTVFKMTNVKAMEEMFKKQHFSWEPVACFYKSDICKKIFFDNNIRFGEDLLFKYTFIKNCDDHILYAPLEKYHYVFRNDSACNSYNLGKKIDDLRVLSFIIEQENNDLGQMIYRREYLPRLMRYYKVGRKSNKLSENKMSEELKSEILSSWREVIDDPEIDLKLKIKFLFVLIIITFNK